MKTHETEIKDCFIIEFDRYEDERGSFQEILSTDNYNVLCKQINWSTSKCGSLRGIHIASFNKIVTCVEGSIFDVIIDFRKDSPTYLKQVAIKLSAKDTKQVMIPQGCGHGILALETLTSIVYSQDKTYQNGANEIGISPFDPNLNINWPKMDAYTLSDKDKNAKNYNGE